MPRVPPRPLCLPDLVKNPQARAEYILSHPPVHGLASTPPLRDSSNYSNTPPSPSSTTGISSHRASAATLASSGSPVTPDSTYTSLSVHNVSWITDLGKRVSGSNGVLMVNAEETKVSPESRAEGKKPRASWSNAFASTKSWFGSSVGAEAKGANATAENKSKEIKLSPSMIAAHAAVSSSPRPVSSPYPSTAELPPLSSTNSTFSLSRIPRVGSGLRYYTEQNPAPPQARVQIPNPIGLQDNVPPRSTLPLHPVGVSLNHTTLDGFLARHPSGTTPPRHPGAAGTKDAMLLGESRVPPSPPPTPPTNMRDNDMPHIKVIVGDEL